MKVKILMFCFIAAFSLVSISAEEYLPCSDDYWEDLNEALGDAIVPDVNPMTSVPTPTYVPRPNERFEVSGHTLIRISEDSGEVFEELVFLIGLGEYYEFCWDVIVERDGDEYSYDTVMSSISDAGFNMVRQFLYSGFLNARNDWIYPFLTANNKYALHNYNEAYFDYLNEFISAADEEGITVLLTLFDFSEDIHSGSDHPSAWNPTQCVYGDSSLPSGYKFRTGYMQANFGTEFFNVYSENTPTPTPTGTPNWTPIPRQLNFLGKTQRDFVLKVVRETRHHANVIYEIANEPKSNDSIVAGWANQVSQWIKNGALECDCCSEAIVSITEANAGPPSTSDWDPYNSANRELLRSGWIDMFSRHNCYHGAKTGVDFSLALTTPIPMPSTSYTATPLPAPFNDDTINVWQEGAMIYGDYKYILDSPTVYPKAFLVDRPFPKSQITGFIISC